MSFGLIFYFVLVKMRFEMGSFGKVTNGHSIGIFQLVFNGQRECKKNELKTDSRIILHKE